MGGPLSPPTERFFPQVGPRNGVLSEEFMDEVPEVGDGLAHLSKTMPENFDKWEIPETTVESLVNNCLFERTQVWKKRRTVAPEPESGENFEDVMAVLRRKLEQYHMEIQQWNGLVVQKGEEIADLKMEVEELRGELQRLEDMKCLQTERWRKDAKALAIELKVKKREMEAMRRNAEPEKWRKEAKRLATELRVKNREMLAQRRNSERDKLQLEDSHKLECDALRLKEQLTEGFVKAVFRNYRTAIGDTESRKLEKVAAETHLRWVESTRLGGCGLNTALDLPMDAQSIKRRGFLDAMEQHFDTVFKRKEYLEAVEQYFDAKFKSEALNATVVKRREYLEAVEQHFDTKFKSEALNVPLDPHSEGAQESMECNEASRSSTEAERFPQIVFDLEEQS